MSNIDVKQANREITQAIEKAEQEEYSNLNHYFKLIEIKELYYLMIIQSAQIF